MAKEYLDTTIGTRSSYHEEETDGAIMSLEGNDHNHEIKVKGWLKPGYRARIYRASNGEDVVDFAKLGPLPSSG